MKKIFISLACAVICCACDARHNNSAADEQKDIQTEAVSDAQLMSRKTSKQRLYLMLTTIRKVLPMARWHQTSLSMTSMASHCLCQV